MTIIDTILDILAEVCVPNQPSPTSMKLEKPPKKGWKRHSDFISIAFLDLASIRVSRILWVWKSRLEGMDLKTWSHIRQNWLGTAHHVTFWYSTYASYIKTSFLTILGCECKLQLEREKSLRFDSNIIASLILKKTTWKSHDKQIWFPAPDIILWPSQLCRVLGWTLLKSVSRIIFRIKGTVTSSASLSSWSAEIPSWDRTKERNTPPSTSKHCHWLNVTQCTPPHSNIPSSNNQQHACHFHIRLFWTSLFWKIENSSSYN